MSKLCDLVMSVFNTDSYKLSHKGFMNPGTEYIFSNGTARSDKHSPLPQELRDGKIVWYGLSKFMQEVLIAEWNETFFNKNWGTEILPELMMYLGAYLGMEDFEHFKALHELGYLPIEIRSLPEGSLVPIRVPVYVMYNTDAKFPWLTNYIETVMSCEVWKPFTVATIIRAYKDLANRYARLTLGDSAVDEYPMFSGMHPTDWQIHGFEFRGMSGRHDAATCGSAFLMSSLGTDTIPAVMTLVKYYDAKIGQELIASSVPASEHSISCLGTAVDGELESYRKWITQDYPCGIVSLVSDTFDYWKVLTEYLPALKADILARPANALGLSKVVIRPDSGNPADIICGTVPGVKIDSSQLVGMGLSAVGEFFEKGDTIRTADGVYFTLNNNVLSEVIATPEQKGSIEILWEIFGGKLSSKGHKILHDKIGLIYGDSITPALAMDIFERLERKGYASTNVVLGVGSYTSQFVTRDTFGFAVKATAAVVDGKLYELFKDPKTDDGVKKSAKGLVKVHLDDSGEYAYSDQVSLEDFTSSDNCLVPVFRNGELLVKPTMSEIRQRLWG